MKTSAKIVVAIALAGAAILALVECKPSGSTNSSDQSSAPAASSSAPAASSAAAAQTATPAPAAPSSSVATPASGGYDHPWRHSLHQHSSRDGERG